MFPWHEENLSWFGKGKELQCRECFRLAGPTAHGATRVVGGTSTSDFIGIIIGWTILEDKTIFASAKDILPNECR